MRTFLGSICRPAAGLLLPILTLFAAGCSSVLDSSDRYAKNARVVLTGEADAPLVMVTSTNWLPVFDPETGEEFIALVDSAVHNITLPVDTTFAFTNTRRFVVRVVNTDTAQGANLRMRVYLDKDLKTDQSHTITGTPMQFSWRYLF